MNREKKFKAWDVVFKEMFFVYQINWHKGKIIDIFGCNDVFDTKWLDPNLTILLEYTGRKDKNGKEIYEGGRYKDKDGTYVIEYDQACFCCKDEKSGVSFELYCLYEGLELIGHIHEQG